MGKAAIDFAEGTADYKSIEKITSDRW